MACAAIVVAMTAAARAQDPEAAARPAFSLASSQIYTTRDSASIDLTFQMVDHLDFRIYRVKDAKAFFAGLKDPHQFGSPEPVVAQEQTWLEWLAEWKSSRRSDVRNFMRRQVSTTYRSERRKQIDKGETSQRQMLRYTTFAQVPLLNDSQLVASWREMLPRVQEAESRRLPLELPGPGAYLVEAVSPPHRAYTIVVVSDVGLVTKAAPKQALMFAANRFSGEPLGNCVASVVVDQKVLFTGSTTGDGTSLAPIDTTNPDAVVAVAQCGNDIVVSDPGAYQFQGAARDLVAYIYTDKPIYRPGHTVRLKGVLRWRERDAVLAFDQPQAELSIVDPDEKVLLRQQVKVDAFGAIKGDFAVPMTAPLGYYTVRVTSGDQNATGSFEVQEYRKPEFEVSVTPAQRFVVQGKKVSATITARYYFGQPVANGAVTYALYKTSYYSPFRWQDDADESEYAGYDYAGEQIGEETARLNEKGEATITVEMPEDDNSRDYTLRIDARVTDASGREVSGKGRAVGTYGDFFVTTNLDRYVYQPGSSAELRIRASDYQGGVKAGVPVSVTLERVEYKSGYGNEPTVTTIGEGKVTTDAEGRASWKATFPKDQTGSFRFRASAPSGERTVTDDSTAYISGYDEDRYTDEGDQYLELVADQKSYAPGQTAKLLIRGAEMDATVLVTKEAQSIGWHQVMRIKAGQAIEVPVTDSDIGDTWVNIAFLKDDKLYRAERKLRVPEVSRGLQVSVTAAQAVAKPREPGVFTIKTTDAAGAPVRAQVSLAVVDEAVFAVKPDETPDPVRFFYRREYSRVSTSFSREYSFIGYSGPDGLTLARRNSARRRPLALADFKGDKEARPHVRKEFPDAIYWIADLTTDDTGTATAKVTYPDALTTWRLTARAITADTRAGSTLSRTTTTKDVILRVITPRFLTEGDTVRVPTVAHNYLTEARQMTVSVEAKNLKPIDATATAVQQVNIASGGEQRHEWPFSAATVGTASITGTLTTPGDGDAVEQSLPVLPYGLKREVGSSGSVIGGERTLELTIPEQSNPAARTIEIALAPSMAGAMLSALDFLAEYPYGCTEQTVSSFFPNLVVLRALADLKLAPTERLTMIDRMSANGIKRLLDLQHDDGGWGWWKTDQNHPFMTAYALWALVEAHKANQKMDTWRIRQAVDAAAKLYGEYPRMIPEMKAYMVYVFGQAAARDFTPSSSGEGPAYDHKKAIDELWDARDKLTPYTKALLLMTLDVAKDGRGEALAKDLVGSAQTKGELTWWPSDNDPLLDDWADTSVEATAFALLALAPRMPNDPLLERASRWLLLNRNGGYYWTSTKQTAFALMGMLAHLRARGEKPATMAVDVEVNGAKVGTHTFTPEQWTAANPIVLTAPGQTGVNKVRLVTRAGGGSGAKDGPGAVYYTATARYYDNRESLQREGSHQLALSRQYFSLAPVTKNGKIVYREQPFSGSAKPGDLLLVRLVAAGSKDWRYIMLEDPLPAGAEAVRDPDLYALEKRPDWWYGSNREYRDNRIVQFQTDFDRGRYEYTYILKIVTPGTFRAMPAQMTAMYVPDAFATSGTQTVEVLSADPAAPTSSPQAAAAGVAPAIKPAGGVQ